MPKGSPTFDTKGAAIYHRITGGAELASASACYTYDALGNLASMIDGRGKTTSYGYDASGRMVSLTDPTNSATSYTYDALGRRISQSQRGSANALISWTYDGAGRVLTRVAGGQTTSYTYDDNGNRLTAASSTGTITTTYDRLNRPLTVSVSGDSAARDRGQTKDVVAGQVAGQEEELMLGDLRIRLQRSSTRQFGHRPLECLETGEGVLHGAVELGMGSRPTIVPASAIPGPEHQHEGVGHVDARKPRLLGLDRSRNDRFPGDRLRGLVGHAVQRGGPLSPRPVITLLMNTERPRQ